MDDRTFRRDFFRQLADAALEPDDPRYVRIYEDDRIAQDDPIALMHDKIEFAVGPSVQLFSGFKGSGKSTELRRLRARLREAGYLVLLVDAEDYLNLSLPVDVPDFLLAVAGALGEAVVAERLLDDDPTTVSYWDRFGNFLKRVRLVVDSVEHIRGISTNAEQVQRSVESLFAVHASRLHLPGLHTIYTVPPWLKVLYPGLSTLYEPGGVQVLPTLKVTTKDGKPFEPGLDILTHVTAARGDWTRLITAGSLHRVIAQSGGHLRDLLRILGDVVLRASSLPTTDEVVDRALSAARTEMLPIADDDARWLAQIAADHDVALPDVDRLPSLARFLDTHLVLCYRNGHEWYDVHPLIRDTVLAQAGSAAPQP